MLEPSIPILAVPLHYRDKSVSPAGAWSRRRPPQGPFQPDDVDELASCLNPEKCRVYAYTSSIWKKPLISSRPRVAEKSPRLRGYRQRTQSGPALDPSHAPVEAVRGGRLLSACDTTVLSVQERYGAVPL